MTRISPTPKTIQRLYALSGNRCAFPWCKELITSSEKNQLMANVCHIESAEPKWERYNKSQTDEQRRSFENLILLCPNHHIETDNVVTYPVDILLEMKRKHEDKTQLEPAVFQEFQKYPSILGKIITEIRIQSVFNDKSKISNNKEFSIAKKIEFNSVKRYRTIINQYKIYQGKLDKIYKEIEKNGSSDKEILLEEIHWLYEMGKINLWIFEDDITKIQENADTLIDLVKSELYKTIEKSSNIENIPIEALNVGILIIIVDAFMRCKILEEPPKNPSSYVSI